MNPITLKNKFSGFAEHGFRPYQAEAIEFAVNSHKPIVVIQAPTGFGKSLVGACIGASQGEFTYLVSSKQLQRQLNHDFPEIKVMKGRNNYACQRIPGAFCDECTHSKSSPCPWKSDCNYEVAKRAVLGSKYRLLNYHYFLFEANFVGKFSNQNIIICDEGDLVEGLLADFISLQISGKALRTLNISLPSHKTAQSAKAVTEWTEWARDVLLAAEKRRQWLEIMLNQELPEDEFKEYSSELKTVESICFQADVFIDNVDKTWIHERRQAYRYATPSLLFRPTWLTEKLSEEFFFKHAKKFVLMSATFPPVQILGKLLGRPPGDFDYYQAGSSFPVKNRQVYLKPVANLTKKTMDDDEDVFNAILDAIFNICSKHVNDKGVIHTVSYKIRNLIMAQGLDRFITHDGKNREVIIDEFINSDRPLVLVSPSAERGIDLPDDLCRFIVWCKCPYMSLGDKLTQKRCYSGKVGSMWYKSLAAQAIVQGCGRGVRHKDDWCSTYCLDEQIYDLVLKKGFLFPQYFRDAVEIV